jgi:metal-sulfur cluster biosynthetic enzyme
MTPVRREDVLAAIDQIVDPCSANAGAPAGLNELGLVKRLRLLDGAAGAAVELRLRLTSPGCMMGGAFLDEIHRRVGALPGVSSVDARLDEHFDWTAADMDEGYAERLRRYRSWRGTPRLPAAGER